MTQCQGGAVRVVATWHGAIGIKSCSSCRPLGKQPVAVVSSMKTSVLFAVVAASLLRLLPSIPLILIRWKFGPISGPGVPGSLRDAARNEGAIS